MPFKFLTLNATISVLEDFREDYFIENFFSYFQSETPFRNPFYGREYCEENISNKVKHFSQILEYLEEEIHQVVTTTNQTSINVYFDRIKEWRNHYRNTTTDSFLIVLLNYNERAYQKYLEQVMKKSLDYFKNEDIEKYNHLQEYEEDDYRGFLRFGNLPASPQKVKRINYKFYCVDSYPEMADLDFRDKYYSFVLSMYNKFFEVIRKHVQLYDDGKYVSSNSFTIVNPQFALEAPPLPNQNKLDTDNRLKTKLTVPQNCLHF